MTTLTLPWPPSNNTYYRRVGAKTLISEKGRQYAKTVSQLCLISKVAKREGRLQVVITACPPDRRKRDLDNLLKGLLDALTHGGAWQDDSQIDDLRIVRGPIQVGGTVSIEIAEITQCA
ncbi:crossover junction endodeoxyribonuclease RusA [Pseudomonas duriflava]|uniref:Crossover junction endodeoxyribonuclease rusA n=1 Tax=Pseudomonas duriflava TaxID=459528 RepID=A0A562PVC9_9PSED|nr:RusA family crossover junction endodeoxyribonuclease [Pseudomonas duriflava]TWI48056.1 crossover junction endodeoxyribonuclease RusA [Pseudomonas duriflava]